MSIQPNFSLYSSSSKNIDPTLSSEKTLLRKDLLNEISSQLQSKKVVFISAQPGQGKTVLASQAAVYFHAPHVWYRITPEDEDPVSFLLSLIHAVSDKFPEADTSYLDRIFSSGELREDNLSDLLRAFVGSFFERFKEPVNVIIDDLHLLEKSPSSPQVFLDLLLYSPSNIKFICLSRHNQFLKKNENFASLDIANFDNEVLKFSRTEISRLYNEYFSIPVSKEDVSLLAEISQGWLAALLLLSGQVKNSGIAVLEKFRGVKSIEGIDQINTFFDKEILESLSKGEVEDLCRIALLEEAPLNLAKKLIDNDQVEGILKGLSIKNFFIREIEPSSNTFLFHSLLRGALLEKGNTLLSFEEKALVMNKAGLFYSEKNQYIQAAEYFVKAENYTGAEQILERMGVLLYARNQTATLAKIVQQIPENIIEKNPWLALYNGIININISPSNAYRFYGIARKFFVNVGNTWGEMLSLVQLIHFHLYIDGQHNLGRSNLHRLEKLFQENQSSLEPIPLMRFANAISGGYCFFDYNAEKVDSYSQIALELAHRLELPNYLAAIRAVNCYRYSFVGDWTKFTEEIEASLPLLKNTRVSKEHKLGLIMAQLSVLIMKGDFANYVRKKEWLIDAFGKNTTSLSVIEPFLIIYDASLFIAQQRFSEASRVIADGLNLQGAGSIPHQRSQILHFAALFEAVAGNRDKAIRLAEESRKLRLIVGTGRFDALNQIFLGITYTLFEEDEEAEQYFKGAIQITEAMQDHHLIASAYFNLAYLQIQKKQFDYARESLRKALSQMETHNYVFFFGWVPHIVEATLQAAINWGISSDYVQKLAKTRLGLRLQAEEQPIPVLEFNVTSGFSLNINGKRVAEEIDFSPIQRQCLAMLLISPRHRISQETLQAILWPDSPEAKARSNFDTMLSRLRKTLSPLVAPVPVKSYLYLQKGLLGFVGVTSDIEAFKAHAISALKYAQKKLFWQAETHAYLAKISWNGRPLLNLPANEALDLARDELEGLFMKWSILWSNLLAQNGRLGEAIELLNQALQINPIEHEIVQSLYALSVKAKLPGQAAKVLQLYKKNLEREEYLPAEIDEILESFWESS